MKLFAFGLGVGTKNKKGEWLEAYFAEPRIGPLSADAAELAKVLGYAGGNQVIEVRDPIFLRRIGSYVVYGESKQPLVAVFLAADTAPESVPEAYLKLHLISHRLVRPHGIDLTGIFKILPNVAWTSRGGVGVAELAEEQRAARLTGQPLEVTMVDKFPKMTDYVVPAGVRIADTARVRLGAYVGPGTTVMQEGFINFNAGTEGPNMIEGRVSSGVWIGAGSDLGGGASTMGVLSGGGKVAVAVGKNCLIGANAGLGIALGDDCTIEAGLYLTAAAKVRSLGRDGKVVRTVKAAELSGRSNLLFRRNSLDGAIECLPNKAPARLNQDLHSHQ